MVRTLPLTLLLFLTLSCGGPQGGSSADTQISDANAAPTDGDEPPAEDATVPEQPAVHRAPADAPMAPEGWPGEEPGRILAALRANPFVTTFLELAAEVGIIEVLETGQGLTLLVPTNAAFDALPEGLLDTIRADPPRLRNVLANHFLMGTMRTSSLSEQTEQATLSQGRDNYAIAQSADRLSIGPAALIHADIECEDGILHLTDVVLLPEAFDPERTPSPFGVNLWVLEPSAE